MPCEIEVRLFDQFGIEIDFDIIGVRYIENGESMDMLSASAGAMRGAVSRNRILHPKEWDLREVEVTIKDRAGREIKRPVPVFGCQQRISLRYGESDTGGDVGWSTITGQIVGCSFDGYWWIRAMPMFGGTEFRPSFEGAVRSNGKFEVSASFDGERHILVVGEGNVPLKVFALNLVKGGKNDAGVIDLSGLCPPASAKGK